MIDLSNQKILVTGASRGIGMAISELLLNEGATVGLHFNSSYEPVGKLIEVYGSVKCIPIKANLLHRQEVVSLFTEAENRLQNIDTLVINAGIFKTQPLNDSLDSWLETWEETMRVNLDAAGILTKLSLEHFMERKQGRIVYIGSRAASRGETAEYLAYAASKGGLTSLAKSVARSFGRYNIKAFTIAPGFTKTEMAMEAISKIGVEEVVSNTALNQLTLPSDIAPLVALMCSGKMDHATGATIDINAGSHIH